ncbi:Cytokinin riboside 5'-monophosphate phosphoribohydrolase log7 [Orobanche hederae]
MEEEKKSRFKRICVFCGSSSGNKSTYQEAAVQLGRHLVERKIDLVYGGGSIGLMGLISQAVHDGGRHVLGVIPRTLMPREFYYSTHVKIIRELDAMHGIFRFHNNVQTSPPQITGETIGEVRAVSNMHQRKAEMARQADAFIALPGGYGTLEELLEVITWAQLGIHRKPVGLLNVEGYYDCLLSFLDKAVDEGFISQTARTIIVSAPTPKQLVRELEEHIQEYDETTSKLIWEEVERNPIPESGVHT